MKLYTIYDRLAESHCPPFPAKNDGTAIRQFKQFITKNEFDASEFWVYQVAIFDDSTGVIQSDLKQIAINSDLQE